MLHHCRLISPVVRIQVRAERKRERKINKPANSL
jgi:hypothetical protein